MIRNLKKWWKDDSTNYATGLINPKEFHKIFYSFARDFYLLDDEFIPKWKKYIHGILVIHGIIGATICLLAMYSAVNNFNIVLIAEVGAYSMVFFYNLLILTCQVLNVQSYRNLSNSMIEDYDYICTTGQRYRSRYFDYQIETRKICIAFLIFTTSVGLSMVSFTILLLVVFFITRDPNGDEKRTLLFPLWVFDLDLSETPSFEILFLYTNFMILGFAYVYGFSLQTGVLWVRQMSAKVNIIIYCMQDLCEGIKPAKIPEDITHNDRVLKPRLRVIIQHHQSLYNMVDDFAAVNKKLLMMEQKIVSVIVCLTAYGSAEKLAEGEVHFVLILLCIATATVVFISSYLCTFLGIKIRTICDTAFDIPFWTTGPIVRSYLVLMMQRSMRPLPLQAPGFEDITLQTFFRKMVSAYSMFNTLRRTNIGK